MIYISCTRFGDSTDSMKRLSEIIENSFLKGKGPEFLLKENFQKKVSFLINLYNLNIPLRQKLLVYKEKS